MKFRATAKRNSDTAVAPGAAKGYLACLARHTSGLNTDLCLANTGPKSAEIARNLVENL